MTRLVFVLSLASLLGAPLHAFAHDLAVDQLTLWPEPAAGVVRGQLLFDPALTRPRGAPADDDARARVILFVRSNLRLEVDGRSAELALEVRELWTGDGAIAGDSVILRAALPQAARELRVFVGAPFPALAISVEVANAKGSLVPHSALARGGHWSPPYRLASSELSEGWMLGGPGELRVGELRHGLEAPVPPGSARSHPARSTSEAKGEAGAAQEGPAKLGLGHITLGIASLVVAGGLAWLVRRRLRRR